MKKGSIKTGIILFLITIAVMVAVTFVVRYFGLGG
jgi:hypothetical protein